MQENAWVMYFLSHRLVVERLHHAWWSVWNASHCGPAPSVQQSPASGCNWKNWSRLEEAEIKPSPPAESLPCYQIKPTTSDNYGALRLEDKSFKLLASFPLPPLLPSPASTLLPIPPVESPALNASPSCSNQSNQSQPAGYLLVRFSAPLQPSKLGNLTLVTCAHPLCNLSSSPFSACVLATSFKTPAHHNPLSPTPAASTFSAPPARLSCNLSFILTLSLSPFSACLPSRPPLSHPLFPPR